VSDTDDLVAALAPVSTAFRRLGVAHYVGGSVASTFHGAIRSTMDVDLVCDLPADKVDEFLTAFHDDFYVSGPAVREAVKRRSCFNVIHLPTSFKVDVFVSRDRLFDRSAMSRATPHTLGESDGFVVPIATAEDSIIAKLEWFRLGNEASERQWDDVSRLMKLHRGTLDEAYMRRMAKSVGVGDLLDRLFSAS
jgi:hypothetical protein